MCKVFPLFLLTLFQVFAQTTDQKSFFSYHILTSIPKNYNYFVTKKSANNIPFRKISLNWKEHFKTREKHVLLRFFQISLLQGYMVELCYIKGVKKNPFADVLQNMCRWKFCKIHRKTSMLEWLFNKVAELKRLYHKCFLWFLRNF